MAKFDELTFILDTIEIDDGEDAKLLWKKVAGYLAKLNPQRKRLIVYICSEP